MTVRRSLAAGLVMLLGLALLSLPPLVQSKPAQAATANGDAIVHLFQWRWESVAQECEDVLGPNGYGAVQVSPPQEHVVLPDEGYPWWQDYQPVSYTIDQTRRGTRADFVDMVTRCRDVGVKIYVDAILNHMTGTGSIDSGDGSAGSSYDKYSYADLFGDGQYGYSSQDFHDCRSDISNWGDPWEVRHCELVGLSDLKTETSYVREMEARYLNELISLGVAGFRIDAAKHMAPADISAVRSQLDEVPYWGGAPYIYQEVIADSAISESEYTGDGDVTEFDYHRSVSHAFADGNLSGLSSLGSSMSIGGDAASVFVANHDTQRSDPILTHRNDRARYDLAQSFLLAHPYGTPKVMSSYDWSGSTDQGPPMASDGTTLATDCDDSAWVCEHRDVAGMVGFHNAVEGTSAGDWHSGNSGQLAFTRGSSGFAAFNATGSAWNATFDTNLPDGEYCDVANGTFVDDTCDSPNSYEVSGGTLTAQVPANGALALHVDALGSCTDPEGCDPGEEGDTVSTSFNATVETSYGQEVYVVGSLPELGAWDPANGLHLSADTYPVWTATLDLPADTTFEYKYVKLTTDGTLEWENDPNRSATVSGSSATLTDTWNQTSGGGSECSTISSSFEATVETSYGQEVYVVGSLPELGAWDPANGLHLSADTYPVWTATVDLPADTTFEYKYVKLTTDGTVEWESGANRSATAEDNAGGCAQTLTGTWS
ncbi:carbohydrate-binding module family 20 domain-containing protein [Salinactinospora qingdaonensis]|uniref:Alpha-amylase n=1 Tax=Salinactinospora qingdaonensis TaxID=702744 RepID=A0ABP7GIF7_9ACTN